MTTHGFDSLPIHRRVVTGLDAQGRSTVILDGPIPQLNAMSAALAWRTAATPADNADNADPIAPYAVDMLHTPGSNFAICSFAPGARALMHATDTLDYLVILSGRVTLVLEAGEVTVGPGDCIADRGVMHGWANPFDVACVAAVVNLPAHPVGAGRTI